MKKEKEKLKRLSRFDQDDKIPHPASPSKGEGRIKVAIAMSGGVDSSVAAKILVDLGFEVVGFMMKLWSDPSCPSSCPRENACCDDQGVMDAKEVADKIGIPFYLINAKKVFKKEIVDYFIEEYKNLRTPNPCAKCNEKIKFGWLLDFAKKTGCDYLATGHYARIKDDSGISNLKFLISNQFQNNNDLKNKSYHLLRGLDENKDQSYFLYNLDQSQLSKILFPVGEYTKEEVRAMAKKWDLPVFEKRESQEICFIQDKDFRDFLKRNIPAEYFKLGQIVDKAGNVLGKHEGLINYTVGQRKGVDQGQGSRAEGQDKLPLYVIGFDQKKNQLIVGEDKEIYASEMNVENLSWINSSYRLSVIGCRNLRVKIRYRHPAVECKIEKADNRIQITENLMVKIRYRHPAVPCKAIIPACRQAWHDSKYIIQFDQSQRAITPGQSAVFYDGDEILGGGIIK